MGKDPHTAAVRSSRRGPEPLGSSSAQGEGRPLPRAPAPPFVLESPSPSEQRASFRVGDSWCASSVLSLRSGLRLEVTRGRFDPSASFSVDQAPSEIEIVVSRGAEIRARAGSGHELVRGGNTLQLGRITRPLPLEIRAAGDQPMECVSVSMSRARLCELLGTEGLPAGFSGVLEGKGPVSLLSLGMTAGLFRLLDELVNADVKGPSRLLWHEAKSLELLALMTDEIAEASSESGPRLSAHDVDGLHRVRRCLLEHLDEPPTLAALAKLAAMSETRLKGGFRALFGRPVFAFVREARLSEARRLLLERRLGVTEAASRVGYANASKFAAAFRRQFGVSPSEI